MRGNCLNWRKSVVALSALVFVSQNALAAINFADVTGNYWANQYIQYLSGRNIITGYPDNTFRPNKPVTRAEFAVMLAKSKGMATGAGGGQVFNDVPASHWAAQAIQSVANQGWIAGYPGGMFLPNQNISMAEMYTILAKAANQPQVSATEAETVLTGFQDAAMIPAWARVPVATAIRAGINVDELSANNILPNTQATRASVATSIAKLVNPSFRETGLAQQPQQPAGNSLVVTGTLQATATPGEWVIVSNDGKRYYFTNPATTITNQPWFKVGNQVELTGRLDPQASTTQRQVVTLNNLVAVQPQQNMITVTGTVRPSTQTQGGWLIETADNKTYRILNPEAFTNTNLIRFGSNVTVTGNLRPDVNLPQGEGSALVASRIETAQTTNQVAVTGTLRPTVEVGGWTVTGPNNQKYVLLGTDPVENQNWFKSGSEVMVRGSVRTDIPNIYQEGPVLVVTSIEPSPNAIQGTQQVSLYYPNLINIVRDPSMMLGNPVLRVLQGPNLPQKAITAILQGPSDVERLQGFFVDDDVKQLTLEQFNVAADGTATVVLEAPANFQFKNTLTPNRLDEQIERTLRQFSGIQDVDMAVKGPDNSVIWTSPQD